MAGGDEYRIRWAVVERCNGYRCWPERMCIAERRIRFLWLIPIWWPTDVSAWRLTEEKAARDIERDRALCAPLPPPRPVI